MKTVKNTAHACFCPNAASRRYRIDRAIDTALTAAATVGLTAALLFFLQL